MVFDGDRVFLGVTRIVRSASEVRVVVVMGVKILVSDWLFAFLMGKLLLDAVVVGCMW